VLRYPRHVISDVIDIADLIDEERYPVRRLDGPEGIGLVERARQQLTETGAVELDGFIRPDRLQMLVDDAEALVPRSHRSEGEGTAYLEVPDFSLPEGHPRLTWGHDGVGAVADAPFNGYYLPRGNARTDPDVLRSDPGFWVRVLIDPEPTPGMCGGGLIRRPRS
jgi:hypothetical protein